MLITIQSFSGAIPRIGSRLLDPNQATTARNAKFWSGELRPLLEDKAVVEIEPATGTAFQTLYRYDHPTLDPIWLRNLEQLSITKGPVLADTKNRVYFSGLDVPRVTNSDLILADETAFTTSNSYPLSVPKPTETAEMVVSGTGSGQAEARAYVYTYARQWDTEKLDESAPSSPAQTVGGDLTVDVENDQTVTLSNLGDTTRTDLTHMIIYRSNTGSTTSSYNKVIKFNLADARAGSVANVTYDDVNDLFTFTDDVLTEDLSGELVSQDWDVPLDELQGIVSLNNGILVGYTGNDLYMSYPFQPHAWPASYRKTVDYPITGIGHFGNTVVILTEAFPHLLTVSTPESAALTPINEVAPCVSSRSIVNAGDAVYYASTVGIVRVSSSGVNLVTQALYSKEEWQALNPESMHSALYEGRYYTFYTLEDGSSDSLVIDFVEGNAGVSTISGYYETYYVEPEENKLYYIKRRTDSTRYVWELEGDSAAHRSYTWMSKKFIVPTGPVNLAAARVLGELPYKDPWINEQEEIEDNNSIFEDKELEGELNQATVNEITLGGDKLTNLYAKYSDASAVSFKLYADGSLIHTEEVTVNQAFRLPAGIVGTEYQCEISGNLNVFRVDLATSMSEVPS